MATAPSLAFPAQQTSLIRRLDETGLPLLLARVILGGLFIYMGAVKLGDPVAFLKLINQYQMNLPPFFLNSVAVALPWFEILCGTALILGIFLRGSAVLIAIMLLAFTPVVLNRAFGIMAAEGIPFMDVKFDCGCGAGEVYIWKKTIENTAFLLLSLIVLFSCSRRFTLELFLARYNPEFLFCRLCGYASRQPKAGLCEKCATPPQLPIGQPLA